MDFDLNVLTTRELDELGKRIHEDGKFGADYAPMKKPEKIAFILSEAVRLYGTTDGTAVLIENAKGVLAARDEHGAEFEDADNASACDAGANSKETKPQDAEEEKNESAGGFGFQAGGEQAGGENRCPDPNCRDDAECPNFEHKGTCPECDVPFANVGHHTKTDDGELCPIEEKLLAFHGEGSGSGKPSGKPGPGKPNPGEMDLVSLIRAVTHEEHDPTFIEVGKALGRAENVVRTVIGTVEMVRKATEAWNPSRKRARRKLITAPNLTITFPNYPLIILDGKHPVIFPQVMALMSLPDGVRQPVLLYGDAGGGKSTVAEQVADAFASFP